MSCHSKVVLNNHVSILLFHFPSDPSSFFNLWYVSSPGYNSKVHSLSLGSQFKIHYQTVFGKYIRTPLWFHFPGDPRSFSIFHVFLALVINWSFQVIPATSLTLPLLGRYLLFSMVSFSNIHLDFISLDIQSSPAYYFENKKLLMFLLRCWWLYPCVLPLLSWTCIIGSPAHTRCQLGWDEDIDKDKPLPYQHHQNQYRNHHHHNHHGTQVRAVLIQKMPGILLMRVPKQVHQVYLYPQFK